jgi:hypothetical protein
MAVLVKDAMFEAHIATSGTAQRSRNQIVLIVASKILIDPVTKR